MRPLDRNATIALVSLIIVTGFAVAVIYHYYQGMHGGACFCNVRLVTPTGPPEHPEWHFSSPQYPFLYIGEQYPADTFLFRPGYMFSDFHDAYDMMKDPEEFRRTGRDFAYNHFPFSHLFTIPFLAFSRDTATGLYLLVFSAGFLLIARVNLKGPTRWDTWRNVVIFSALTYPFLFALDRGNDEVMVFLALYGFVHLIEKGHYRLAALPLAVAMAVKPFPAFLLPLFVVAKPPAEAFLAAVRRQGLPAAVLRLWRENAGVAISMVGAIGLNVVAKAVLAAYCFSFDNALLARAWQQTFRDYVIGDQGLFFGNSLWGAMKFVLYHVGYLRWNWSNAEMLAVVVRAARPYMFCMLAFYAALCLYLWRCERTFWKQVAVLVFAMNLCPYVSGDYKLLHVFLPLYLFINRSKSESPDLLYAVLFALILIPKSYYRLAEANLGVVLSPALMLTMVCLIVGSGLLRFRAATAGGENQPRCNDLLVPQVALTPSGLPDGEQG